MNDVGSALVITFGLLAASIVIVGGSVWWLYRVFRNKDDVNTNEAQDNLTSEPQKD